MPCVLHVCVRLLEPCAQTHVLHPRPKPTSPGRRARDHAVAGACARTTHAPDPKLERPATPSVCELSAETSHRSTQAGFSHEFMRPFLGTAPSCAAKCVAQGKKKRKRTSPDSCIPHSQDSGGALFVIVCVSVVESALHIPHAQDSRDAACPIPRANLCSGTLCFFTRQQGCFVCKCLCVCG